MECHGQNPGILALVNGSSQSHSPRLSRTCEDMKIKFFKKSMKIASVHFDQDTCQRVRVNCAIDIC